MSDRLRALVTATAVAALVFSMVVLMVRTLPLPNLPTLVLAVGSPYVPLLAVSGLALSMACRRRLLSIVALAVAVATVAVQVHWYYLASPTDVGRHVEVRVLSSNLRKGQADAATFVPLAKMAADVITVSELTPDEVRRFRDAGIDAEFPYSVLTPEPGAAGIGLWSRFPLTAASPGTYPNVTIAAAWLRIPGVRFNPMVASVHIISPVASDENAFVQWRNGIGTVKELSVDLAAIAGRAAAVIAGDFNSTPDMRQFRDLLTHGYRDAVEQTGAGFSPTFPTNRMIPPLITIDHVLTRQAAATSIRTVEIDGSDHRALLATIAVPADPST